MTTRLFIAGLCRWLGASWMSRFALLLSFLRRYINTVGSRCRESILKHSDYNQGTRRLIPRSIPGLKSLGKEWAYLVRHDSKVPTADFASNDRNLGRSSMWHQLIWGGIIVIVQDWLGDSPSLGPSDLSGSALPSQRHFLSSRVKPKKESVPVNPRSSGEK